MSFFANLPRFLSPLVFGGFLACAAAPADAESDVATSDLATCPGPVRLRAMEKPDAVSHAEAAVRAGHHLDDSSTWYDLKTVDLRTYAPCAMTADITDVEDGLPAVAALRGRDEIASEIVPALPVFRGEAGERFLGALDAWGGGSEREVVRRWDEAPCQGCSAFTIATVVRYRGSRRVAVVAFDYGWD